MTPKRAIQPRVNRETQYLPPVEQMQHPINPFNDNYEEWLDNIRLVARTEFRWSREAAATIQDTDYWKEMFEEGLSPRDAFVEDQQGD